MSLLVKVPATAFGLGAILLWSLLALLTDASGSVPPFQLSAMTFAIASLAGAARWIANPQKIKLLRQSWKVWALGILGLFGYHFMYFSALRAAPTVEASLIAYLWPLLIVLFSALLPADVSNSKSSGKSLNFRHLLGALLGFFGAALIVTSGNGFVLNLEYLPGYAMALAAALIWSSYSVLSRRFAHIPTDIVTGFCMVTAALSLLCHLIFETSVWPDAPSQWLAILLLGLGPVGLAFFIWDIGVKHGNIALLGTLSYLAPLLSTLILIATGAAEASWNIALACILITLGAIIAAFQTKPKRA